MCALRKVTATAVTVVRTAPWRREVQGQRLLVGSSVDSGDRRIISCAFAPRLRRVR